MVTGTNGLKSKMLGLSQEGQSREEDLKGTDGQSSTQTKRCVGRLDRWKFLERSRVQQYRLLFRGHVRQGLKISIRSVNNDANILARTFSMELWEQILEIEEYMKGE